MVTPWAWTDGIRGEADEAGNDIWTWSNTGNNRPVFKDQIHC